MANVIINDTNLTNIANAIREKNGTTNSYKPSEMANAIAAIEAGGGGGGGYEPTDEELKYRGYNDAAPFKGGCNEWLLDLYGNRMLFYLTDKTSRYFYYCKFKDFKWNPKIYPHTSSVTLNETFSWCNSLEKITGALKPREDVNEVVVGGFYKMFEDCQRLREINDNFLDAQKYKIKANVASNLRAMFYDCHSLREIPAFVFNMMNADGTTPIGNNSGSLYYQGFYLCAALNKIENLPVVKQYNGNAITSNMFVDAFYKCYNLHKLTFNTNADGTPIVANWKNQIIDLTQNVGYATSTTTMMYSYNSGLTADDKVESPVSSNDIDNFQYLIGDNLINKYTVNSTDSKYGHTEAVETINSLPDTSATGGGNTIKFKGSQGYYTDYMRGRTDNKLFDSSINKLTEEEIAVAAAKGWTVSIS